MSSFYAVDYKDNKLGILDKEDGVVDYYSPTEIKEIIKKYNITINGVKVLEENYNPLLCLDGLQVNLAYRNFKKFGKWIVVLLRNGDRFGLSLSSRVTGDTVLFYDTSVNWSKQEYPYGQYVSSYYLDSILEHEGKLKLQADIPSWAVSKEHMLKIKDWLKEVSVQI